MIIKKVGSESIGIIQSLAHYIWHSTYNTILSEDQMSYMLELIYSKASLHQQIEEQHHQFIISYNNDLPVGFASYSPKNKSDAGIYRLHKIYLDPKLHGKGYGRILLNHVLTNIKQAGAQSLELNVNRQNKALYFYQKTGFTILKEEDVDIGNGYFMNDYVLNLEL